MKTARRFLRALNAVESIVAALAYVIVAALLIGDIVGREILGKGIFGASRMAVFAAIIAGFLGLSLATAANAHIRPGFMDWVLPGAWADRIGDVFACVFFGAAGVFAILFVIQSYDYQEKAAVIYWQLWQIQLVIPYAFFSTALKHGIFAAWPGLKPFGGRAAA